MRFYSVVTMFLICASAHAAVPQSKLLRFFPQSGVLWQDLAPINWVDVDSSSGVRDWNGTQYTYNGHDAVDMAPLGFAEMDIGVPVFAALDGIVIDTHDGEYDRNTTLGARPANYVVIAHGDGLYTRYYHLRKGSVAVKAGDAVPEGRQIGLVGSSGNSNFPHLDFAYIENDKALETFHGAGNALESRWVSQPAMPTGPIITDFAFFDPTDNVILPNDFRRTGTFLKNTMIAWMYHGVNFPRSYTAHFTFIRPDGTTAATYSDTATFDPLNSYTWDAWDYTFFDATPVGTWKIQMRVDGVLVLEAPFAFVSNQVYIVNRPPRAITAEFRLATGSIATCAPVCAITSPHLCDDYDYGTVRYTYLWKINGKTVRTVISAGMSDVLPKGLVKYNDKLECVITPSDGVMDGAPTTISRIEKKNAAEPGWLGAR
ncbi:MAG: M23 family metallopeptidase [Candidatus Sumerlaeia bacterium]